MLFKLLREGFNGVKPTHVAVVFDHSEKTFRNEIYPDYKGHRPDPPDELIPQFPLMREAVRAFGLIPIEQTGYEADDLIATYARQAVEAGADATIVAGDKDLMQLVRPGVHMFDPDAGTRAADRTRRGDREIRRAAREGARGAGADRRLDRQRAGRAGHRREDRGAADQRIRRPRNAARARAARSSRRSAGNR